MGQPAFGKIHLHRVGAPGQAGPHLRFVFAQQVLDELFPRVAGQGFGGVHEAEGRG